MMKELKLIKHLLSQWKITLTLTILALYYIYTCVYIRISPTRANLRSSFRPIVCFAVELQGFAIALHPQKSRNYGPKALVCMRMAFSYTTCILEVN